MNCGAPIWNGTSRSAPPSLKTTTPAAPRSLASWIFSVNRQVPRWTSAIWPASGWSPAGQSSGSHPLEPVPGPPGGGITMSFDATSGAVTFPAPENCATT